jgi:hypothetical protein
VSDDDDDDLEVRGAMTTTYRFVLDGQAHCSLCDRTDAKTVLMQALCSREYEVEREVALCPPCLGQAVQMLTDFVFRRSPGA